MKAIVHPMKILVSQEKTEFGQRDYKNGYFEQCKWDRWITPYRVSLGNVKEACVLVQTVWIGYLFCLT